MNTVTGLTSEMKRRKGGRFRRFQALDDALTIFLHLHDHPSWFGTSDIIRVMEWEYNEATRKRTRRIGEALVRLGRVETKKVHGGSVGAAERMWRILE